MNEELTDTCTVTDSAAVMTDAEAVQHEAIQIALSLVEGAKELFTALEKANPATLEGFLDLTVALAVVHGKCAALDRIAYECGMNMNALLAEAGLPHIGDNVSEDCN